MRPMLVATCVLVWLLGAAGTATAFHPPLSFEKTANEGGGGGMFFTGSPRHKGYDCAICHVDPDARIGVELTAVPPDLTAGRYAPAASYELTVRLSGEHRGFGARSNQNGFLMEAVDDRGVAVGSFAPIETGSATVVDDGRVLGGRAGPETEWRFRWTAPAAGTGALTLYLGMVDGDGAGNTAESQTDPMGDDVAMLAVRACEGSSGCADRATRPPDESPTAGCAAAGTSTATAVAVVLLLLVALRRRSRTRRASIAAALVLGACFDPSTPGECPGRVCGSSDGGGGDGAPACSESWVCTSWEAPPGSDQATRTCTDANQTGTTDCKPSEGPVTLPALDLEYYKCNVQPVLQRGCSMMACHGTATERAYRIYARGRLRNDEIVNRTGTCIPSSGQVNLDEAGTGTVMCEGWLPHTAAEWKKNFDSARSFMLGVTDPDDSDLLQMPVVGGKPHVEVKLFRATDADYLTIRNWLAGAALGGTCNTGVN